MKIQLFYSDWNGLRSEKPYFKKPTIREIKAALKNEGRLLGEEYNLFVNLHGDIVEVKKLIQEGWSSNLYRDMYRIISK